MAEKRLLRVQFVLALGLATITSLGLLAYGDLRNHSHAYLFLSWNLVLAWVPLGLAIWLATILNRKLWSSWEAVIVTLLWLGFLPNSFYMVSDFVHLQDIQTVDILYDAVMFTSFIYVGVVLGMSSLYLVHNQLRRRVRPRSAAIIIALVILLCSYAIFIGRDLRLNTWDVLVNPAGILFEVSDSFINPLQYSQMLLTVGSFFVLFGSMYLVAWRSIHLLKPAPKALKSDL